MKKKGSFLLCTGTGYLCVLKNQTNFVKRQSKRHNTHTVGG